MSLILILIGVTVCSAQPVWDDAWRDTAQISLRAANDQFAGENSDESPREAALGEAVTWLELPPKTKGQLERGVVLLRRVKNENPHDELGQCARYLLGRIEQTRRSDRTESGELRELIREHPEGVFGQLAMLKVVLNDLYHRGGDPSMAERFSAAAAFESQFTFPRLRCDFHLIMGNAGIFFEYDLAGALRHLQAAVDSGLVQGTLRADLLVQVGELAKELGQGETALTSYRSFLRENESDGRVMMVRDRIVELGGHWE